MKKLKIAVDFDGTCVTHEYPKVGKTVPYAVDVLKKLQAKGYLLILNTMRSGKELKDAEKWFSDNELVLYGSNKDPDQSSWTESPKVYSNIYIDDAALGAPLTNKLGSYNTYRGRPFVDWKLVEKWFKQNKLL